MGFHVASERDNAEQHESVHDTARRSQIVHPGAVDGVGVSSSAVAHWVGVRKQVRLRPLCVRTRKSGSADVLVLLLDAG